MECAVQGDFSVSDLVLDRAKLDLLAAPGVLSREYGFFNLQFCRSVVRCYAQFQDRSFRSQA